MPNRILREGILTSPRIAKLGWPEEVFYRRLHSVVDDFGRYFADAGLLRAACYPRQLSKVTDADIGKWLHACDAAGLVSVYPASDGESYLEILDFKQQVRAKASKFPEPPSNCAADATQPPANAHLDVSVSVSVSEDVKGADAPPPPVDKKTKPQALECPDDVEPQVWDDWQTLRRKKSAPVTVTTVEGARAEAAKAGMSFNEFLKVWCTRGSQGLQADWLQKNGKPAPNSTVPGSKERDPALVKLDEDAKKAGKLTPEIRERMDQIRQGAH